MLYRAVTCVPVCLARESIITGRASQTLTLSSRMQLSFFAALIGIAGACAGAYVPVAHGRARLFVPVSGAILLVVSLFSILPEMAGEAGWYVEF